MRRRHRSYTRLELLAARFREHHYLLRSLLELARPFAISSPRAVGALGNVSILPSSHFELRSGNLILHPRLAPASRHARASTSKCELVREIASKIQNKFQTHRTPGSSRPEACSKHETSRHKDIAHEIRGFQPRMEMQNFVALHVFSGCDFLAMISKPGIPAKVGHDPQMAKVRGHARTVADISGF